MAQFYLPASGALYTDTNLQVNTGFSPNLDPSFLAANGIYTVISTPDPYDPLLYTTVPSFLVAGDYANESWVATPLPLPTAKENAINTEKDRAGTATTDIIDANNVSNDVITSVAGQLLIDRPAPLQTILAEMQVVSDNLGSNIIAIEAATTVDDINNIVNPPTGFIYTGRGGSGGGPLDMNPSYLTSWVSVSMDSTDTELYIPATMTTVPYDDSVPPYQYAQTFGAFTPGNYTVQIRQASTGLYISEWECPLSATEIPVEF